MKARDKTFEKGSKKLDKDKILEKIEQEKRFQKEQMNREEYLSLSKGQKKKFYESMIQSIEKVVKLEEKIGIKSKNYSFYYKTLLNNVNENILRSESRLKRIVLIEKNNNDKNGI